MRLDLILEYIYSCYSVVASVLFVYLLYFQLPPGVLFVCSCDYYDDDGAGTLLTWRFCFLFVSLCDTTQPSTGMDPEARRNMWTVIEQVSAQRSVVLVTHSMEEVEALCTRMAVMVSGRLQCIGSSQHLKGRFGLGYQVEIRSVPEFIPRCIELCRTHMRRTTAAATAAVGSGAAATGDSGSAEEEEVGVIAGAVGVEVVVEEVHGGYARLKVSREVDLAAAFQLLEEHKAALRILDYSISQCTLEQVFLNFAKDQEEEVNPRTGTGTGSSSPVAAPLSVVSSPPSPSVHGV
jgi:energy-coupling factor transporter ATP-binding protein EcfA2